MNNNSDIYLGDITYLSNDIIYQGLQYPDGWLLYRTLPDGTEQRAMPQTEFYRNESQIRAAMTWPDMVRWE